MHPTLYIIYLFLCVSCAIHPTPSTEVGQQKTFTVSLLWQVHTPYCGGAYPTPEQQMGWNSPLGNLEFVILQDSILDMDHVEYGPQVFHTNSNGSVQLALTPGTYFIYKTEKFQTLESLEKKYRPTNDKQMEWEGTDCLKSWRSLPDLRLIVSKDTSIILTENARCFEGTAPCTHYTGPYPP